MNSEKNSDIATKFLSMVASGRVQEGYDLYVADSFQHHNAYFPGDRQSLLSAMQQSAEAEPNKSFVIKQVIASENSVAVYSHLTRVQAGLEYAVVHIMRIENGKIVELWDVGQQIPKDSPNKLGMF